MKFSNAACFFDDDRVLDAYTADYLFNCHTTPHDDQTSSGATGRRRTMTTINSTVAPARGVVQLYGSAWLVSDSNPDSFRGELVRRSYSLKKSTGLMDLLTPGAACLSGVGLPFHTQKEYYRDMQNARTETDWDVMWNIFCSLSEPVIEGSFLRQNGIIFRVRSCYPSIDRFRIAETDEFDSDALQGVTFTMDGKINLITDQMDTISVATSVIQTDNQKFYQFRTEVENAQKPGDRTVFVAKSAITPKVGSQLAMLGERWRVLAVVNEMDSWALQVRRS